MKAHARLSVVAALALVLVQPLSVVTVAAMRQVTRQPSPTYPAPQITPPACLHDNKESSEQAARRTLALAVVRTINTLEMQHRTKNARFLTHPELMQLPAAPGAPLGWQLRLAAGTDNYVFSLKDTTDPCQFAYFSDDTGLIYTAQPLGITQRTR